MSETRTWTRCIVLTPHGFDVGAKVRRLAAARDWVAVEQHDPYLAMAELCIRRRAQRSRKSWGLPSAEKLALIIAEPDQWDQLEHLMAAVRRYAADVPLYSCDGDELNPSSHTGAPEDHDAGEGEPPTDGRPGSATPGATPDEATETAVRFEARPIRPLQLADPGREEALADEDAEADAARDEQQDDEFSASISPEEMEMLLATPSGSEGEEES